jgi:hypothetical protein
MLKKILKIKVGQEDETIIPKNRNAETLRSRN